MSSNSETKPYCQAMIEVLDKLQGYDTISISQMKDGFSEYWATIFDELRTKRVISMNGLGDIRVVKPYISIIRSDYLMKLKRIDEYYEERDIRIKHMRANIKQIKQAKIVSWISIVIALAGLIVSILTATIWK